MSASSPYHQVYFYTFSRLPEPSRAGSEVIIDLRGCQSSLCLTSPPMFIAPVEPRLLVAYLARPCFYMYLGFWCCSTPRRLLSCLQCIDHAFNSFKAANAYKADIQALTLRGNAKSNDTQEKGTSGPQLKGHPHPCNPPSNSTLINFKNNFQSRNPSSGSTQSQRNSQITSKFNDKKTDMRLSTSVSRFQSNQSSPSSDKDSVDAKHPCLSNPQKALTIYKSRLNNDA